MNSSFSCATTSLCPACAAAHGTRRAVTRGATRPGPPAPLGPGVPFFGPMLGSARTSRSHLARPAHRLVRRIGESFSACCRYVIATLRTRTRNNSEKECLYPWRARLARGQCSPDLAGAGGTTSMPAQTSFSRCLSLGAAALVSTLAPSAWAQPAAGAAAPSNAELAARVAEQAIG